MNPKKRKRAPLSAEARMTIVTAMTTTSTVAEAWRWSDSLEPIDYRRMHSNVDVKLGNRDGGFAESTLDRLYNRGTLTAAQWTAGTRLYRDHAFGVCGASEASPTWASEKRDTFTESGVQQHQLDSLMNFRRAVAALGAVHGSYVLPLVIEDCGIEDIRERHHIRRATASDRVRSGLDALADHYAG